MRNGAVSCRKERLRPRGLHVLKCKVVLQLVLGVKLLNKSYLNHGENQKPTRQRKNHENSSKTQYIGHFSIVAFKNPPGMTSYLASLGFILKPLLFLDLCRKMNFK